MNALRSYENINDRLANITRLSLSSLRPITISLPQSLARRRPAFLPPHRHFRLRQREMEKDKFDECDRMRVLGQSAINRASFRLRLRRFWAWYCSPSIKTERAAPRNGTYEGRSKCNGTHFSQNKVEFVILFLDLSPVQFYVPHWTETQEFSDTTFHVVSPFVSNNLHNQTIKYVSSSIGPFERGTADSCAQESVQENCETELKSDVCTSQQKRRCHDTECDVGDFVSLPNCVNVLKCVNVSVLVSRR